MADLVDPRLSSRKFMLLVAVFIASCTFAWFKPEFVGNAQILFNFWIFLLGIYFGANVGEYYTKMKNGK